MLPCEIKHENGLTRFWMVDTGRIQAWQCWHQQKWKGPPARTLFADVNRGMELAFHFEFKISHSESRINFIMYGKRKIAWRRKFLISFTFFCRLVSISQNPLTTSPWRFSRLKRDFASGKFVSRHDNDFGPFDCAALLLTTWRHDDVTSETSEMCRAFCRLICNSFCFLSFFSRAGL